MRATSAPSASTSRSSAAGSMRKPAWRDQRLGLLRALLAASTAATPPRRGSPNRICGRAPACACRRLRNRSGWLRTPATTPGVGSFRYAASGAASPARRPPESPSSSSAAACRAAARASAFTTQIRRSEANSESDARIVEHFGQRQLRRDRAGSTASAGHRRQQRFLDAAPLIGFRARAAASPAGALPFLIRAWNWAGVMVRNSPGWRSRRCAPHPC